MKTLKLDWLILLLIAIPIIFIGINWNQFPEQIPTHFNLQGIPDDYSSKVFGLILLPGINIALYFLFIYLPKIAPSKNKYTNFLVKLRVFRTVLHAFVSFMVVITCLYTLGYNFNMSVIVMYAVATLFLIMGNYLGNIRHNYFIGIRTPWTLADESVWTKTHRMAAKVWVIASIIAIIVMVFLNEELMRIFFTVYVALIVLIPVMFSFIEFKKLKK